MKRRLLLSAAAAGATGLVAGCASPDIADYATEKPALDLRTYFNGTVDAWGMFQDRGGKVIKRFTVVMDCRWEGDTGTLDEHFTYSDGTTQRRVWTLKKTADNRYTGTASDVIGEADGSTDRQLGPTPARMANGQRWKCGCSALGRNAMRSITGKSALMRR